MLRPATQDLPIIRDDDLDFSFHVRTKTPEGVTSNIDLTGFTAEAKILSSTSTPLHTITATITDAAQGKVRLQLSRVTTATLAKTGISWYFALVNPSDVKQTYIVGKVRARDRSD